jgi:hypothetical protein
MKQWGKIIARDLVDTFIGEIDGVVFKIYNSDYSYWEPSYTEIEYLGGYDYIPEDEELDLFEEMLLARISNNDYEIPPEVEKKLRSFLEWESNI